MQQNSFFWGGVLGAITPTVACLLKVFSPLGATMHPLSLYVIAAVVNLLLIRFFYRRELDRTARGLLLVTFVALLFLIILDKPLLA
ncbi:hypothetical protein [Parapedobacter soli]|nr:hypothetical protein [Parapedobacter soli]